MDRQGTGIGSVGTGMTTLPHGVEMNITAFSAWTAG